jgi:hypothetical protein
MMVTGTVHQDNHKDDDVNDDTSASHVAGSEAG